MKSYILIITLFIVVTSNAQDKYKTLKAKDKNGYKYEYITNDPVKTRIYKLQNGLTVYLSVNKDEPRIQSFIAVKAGSKNDPKNTTGLAHYLEHMMFKGTDEIGSLNWEKEKALLDQISGLFEKRLNEKDSLKRVLIYRDIDSLSSIAAKYAVPGEYDKMLKTIGATDNNAFTINDQTVYQVNIPSNEFEKWMKLESERFSRLVLRLFHTELETVYEEFNRAQDNDSRRFDYAMNAELFKNHPYGTQTTLGKAEHLKNPSMVNIYNFFNTYYVPNNMAVCLAGDFEYEEAIKLVDKYWSSFKPNNNLPKLEFAKEEPISSPVKVEVFGPESEKVRIEYRFGGKNSDDKKYVIMLSELLCNEKAGLIDLNINKKQKTLNSWADNNVRNDYSLIELEGEPRENQTLEEVQQLLLNEVENIKKGNFDDYLIEAVINNLKLKKIKSFDNKTNTAINYAFSFTENQTWEQYLNEMNELSKLTKKDIVDFANKNLNNNYVVGYKRKGEAQNLPKVSKPKITSVVMNSSEESEYLKNFKLIESKDIKPVYINYDSAIVKENIKGVELNYVKNNSNELFSLSYILDIGKYNDIYIPLAFNYLPYLGTKTQSIDELEKELFRYGLSFDVFSTETRSYIKISGLNQNFEKGVEILEKIINNIEPNKEAYDKYIDGILKERAESKTNKNVIIRDKLFTYARYGENSPSKYIISENDLKNLDPVKLTDLVKNVFKYPHYIFYYGNKEIKDVKNTISKIHNIPEKFNDIPEKIKFTELPTDKTEIYFVDYQGMLQSQIAIFSLDEKFNKNNVPYSLVFNNFYGMGLSSVVFQEIRESKGLAYQAYASYTRPVELERPHFVFGFLGTQPDKSKIALDALFNILSNMPEAPNLFENSKLALLKSLSSERITKESILWSYLANKDLGINYDYRKDTYEAVKKMSYQDMKNFFNNKISNKKFKVLILGDEKALDFNALSTFGEVKKFKLEDIFYY